MCDDTKEQVCDLIGGYRPGCIEFSGAVYLPRIFCGREKISIYIWRKDYYNERQIDWENRCHGDLENRGG